MQQILQENEIGQPSRSNQTMDYFRCKNVEQNNKYWLEEERKLCRMCKKEKEIIKHMNECGEIRRGKADNYSTTCEMDLTG